MQEWKPQKKQELALQSKASEILYGGARGGGKTDCGIVWVLKGYEYGQARSLVIRRNATDLGDWIDRACQLLKRYIKRVRGHPAEIILGSGHKIVTGHLATDDAYERYQGHEYPRILVEELTHIASASAYEKLLASNRSTVAGLDARVFCTTNPTGPGKAWVKQRFVDIGAPYKIHKLGARSRQFIASTVHDNPALISADPDYLLYLESLPDGLREAWLDGSWDHTVGAFFHTFDRARHVYRAADYTPSKHAHVYRSIDWGFNDPMACLWHAVEPDCRVFTFREWYQSGYTDTNAIAAINERSPETVMGTFGDPNSFNVRIERFKFGQSIAEARHIAWAEGGIPIMMPSNDRKLGWSAIRELLESGRWQIADTCAHLIEQLSNAQIDEKNPEDIDQKMPDHALDSLRYFAINQIGQPIIKKPQYKNNMEKAWAEAKKSIDANNY